MAGQDKGKWENYKQVRNQVTSKIKQSKKNYFQEAIRSSKNNSRAIWKHLNQAIHTKSKRCDINRICADGEELSEPISIANTLNDYFANIGPKLAAQISGNNNVEGLLNSKINNSGSNEFVNESFRLVPIDQEFVLKQLKCLTTSKAAGCDNCPARLIKLAAPVIANQLTFLVNLSITTGKFPKKWKKAKITPIHKGGDVSEPGNYRPISVLPIFFLKFLREPCSISFTSI